ncbi:exosortase A [Pontixanthobacter sp.]|uniref:exosortase A n=1 Tax=Pontixanthobacter sp. TaxID=2792078 RepID=UPI003C7CE364
MPRNIAIQTWNIGSWHTALPARWRTPLLCLAAVWTALLILTAGDWWVMADKWWNVSTYNHILFVPFIVGWMVHARKDDLSQLVPQAWWPGLVALGGALFLWLLGSLAGVNTVSQLGAVAALQSAVVLVLGPRIAAANLFPLAYMLFLVPFGDELVPALQMITAKLVIALTQWSAIPAIIDGVFIDTPAGLFEVAEACSGVKFLIAMVALGTLISYSCFSNWKRRIVFMGVATALPILANGVRAWGTIYIAQSQGIAFAEGFDHVVYGWVFFAVVVAALLAVFWPFFDRDPDDLGDDFPNIEHYAWFRRLQSWTITPRAAVGGAALLVALIAAWNIFASRVEADLPASIALPEVQGWSQVPYTPDVPWAPKASGADHRLLGRYQNAAGEHVDIFIGLYSAQEDGREASANGEGALTADTPWRWLAPAASSAQFKGDYLLAYGQLKRRVETSYHTGDLTSGRAVDLKLANMRDRLMLHASPTMLFIASSEEINGQVPADVIADFRQSIGDEGEWMDRIAGLR